ncbi:hypothetical protein [Caulobacter sp. NIBR2454]|uniref:hypothetical protein n=1 Tax=Caulobacter sp. NIBR2454 TaxID=3015996 RepID=UPI0022B71117|nr:hypothetical protein [Caulobacter sp. NIBR2454]
MTASTRRDTASDMTQDKEKTDPKAERDAKLAQALRANLRRRKVGAAGTPKKTSDEQP